VLSEVEPQTHYTLDVVISPPWPNGPVRGSIDLSTGFAQAPEMKVPVSAKLQGRLESKPSMFYVQPGRKTIATQVANLIWSGGPPGRALEVTCSDPELDAGLQDGAAGQQVVLRVPQNYQTDRKGATVIVRTDDKEVPTLRIPIKYRARTRLTPGGPRARTNRIITKGSSARTKVGGTTKTAPSATTKPSGG
jgi:hypothetical protein